VDAKQAAAACAGQPPVLPTTGASSALFALAGACLVTVPGVLVPPGQHMDSPAETVSDVPPPDTIAATGSTAEPGAAGDPDELITGIADAARFLGYDKADSFRRARTRHRIPGETRASDGRPAWHPRALRDWQARRKIAGNRSRDGG
jgi:hypothetical protein